MPSGPDWRAQVQVLFGITGWFVLIFVVTAIGLYLVTSHLVRGALREEWAQKTVVTSTTSATGELEGVTIEKVHTTVVPTPQIQEAVRKQFNRFFPFLMVPIIVIGVVGGLFLTHRATAGLRRVLPTVREILNTGEIHRRVPLKDLRPPIRDLALLFNEALERNERLILRLHQSLDNVAHDLRTPMTRLRATAESALTSPDDPNVCHAAISDCLEESEIVLSMLNTLMDVAEAETGAMRLDLEELDAGAAVESVRDLYELVADERSMQIETDVADGLRVTADKNRLRRVLANLVDNAVKYGPEGSTVRIRARADGEDAVFEVQDEGPGILEDDLPKIWDRLYRGDRSRSQRGLGLGLSFVKAIVTAHGGNVEVATRLGEGSTFSVRLPGVSPRKRPSST